MARRIPVHDLLDIVLEMTGLVYTGAVGSSAFSTDHSVSAPVSDGQARAARPHPRPYALPPTGFLAATDNMCGE